MQASGTPVVLAQVDAGVCQGLGVSQTLSLSPHPSAAACWSLISRLLPLPPPM